MKLRFTAIEPFFETSALIGRHRRLHMSRRLTLGFFDRFGLFDSASRPSRRSISSWKSHQGRQH